jgi:hypothetical protein
MPRWSKSNSFWPKISRKLHFYKNSLLRVIWSQISHFCTNTFFTFRKFANYQNVNRLFVFIFRFRNFFFEYSRIFGTLIKKSFSIFNFRFRLFISNFRKCDSIDRIVSFANFRISTLQP